jgi:hypothetical protein
LDIRNSMKQISLGMKNLIPFTDTYFRWTNRSSLAFSFRISLLMLSSTNSS